MVSCLIFRHPVCVGSLFPPITDTKTVLERAARARPGLDSSLVDVPLSYHFSREQAL